MSTAATEINQNRKRQASAFRDAVLADLAPDSTVDPTVDATMAMQRGENGCLEYTNLGLGSDVLAISQMVRGATPQSLCQSILTSDSTRDVADLIVLLFVTRNTRGGKGEKDLAFHIFLQVWNHYPLTAQKLLKLFPHYGYWKDLLLLAALAKDQRCDFSEALLSEAATLMLQQLQKDNDAVAQYHQALNDTSLTDQERAKLRQKGPAISLLAKWLPRENSHFDKKLGMVRVLTHQQSQPSNNDDDDDDDKKAPQWKSKSKAQYRKQVAKLTAFLELPEVLLSAQRADEINFYKLASKATFKLSNAFLNEHKRRSEDPKRIRLAELFVEHMTHKGLKGAQLMPHEIVQEIRKGSVTPLRAKVLDAQWKSLWKDVVEQVQAKAKEEGLEFNPTRMVPLSDVSGSMSGIPMLVSIALGIGISEITHTAFRDMVLTFETTPRWHKLNPEDSIVQKVQSLASAPWGGSTNFEAAYDLILDVCLQHNLAREDVPTMIVFSDMQFNQAAGWAYGGSNPTKTMHQTIGDKFARVARTLGWEDADPTPIVYWNLRNTGGHPVDKDTEGAVLLAGFSPSLLKLVMNGEALKEEVVEVVEMDGTVREEKIRVTPEQLLRKMLDDSVYDPVREILAESKEGLLGDYEPPTVDAPAGGPSEDGFELI
jgi:Domain of unknown function (DUF2828)